MAVTVADGAHARHGRDRDLNTAINAEFTAGNTSVDATAPTATTLTLTIDQARANGTLATTRAGVTAAVRRLRLLHAGGHGLPPTATASRRAAR